MSLLDADLQPVELTDVEYRRHIDWMIVALSIERRSKCVRAKYASLILDADGEPVTHAVNGKPAGSCNDHVCYREGLPPDANKPKCCLHSEQNAVTFGDRARMKGGTWYLTGMPCEDCALLICQSGIETLVCAEDARAYDGLYVMARYGFSVPGGKIMGLGMAKRLIRILVVPKAIMLVLYDGDY